MLDIKRKIPHNYKDNKYLLNYTNNPVRASTGFDRGLESGEAIRREMR